MKVEKEWQKGPEYLTRMTGTLCDGGLLRIYDNYIEIDKLRFFGSVEGTEIVYYNDITSIQMSRKQFAFS